MSNLVAVSLVLFLGIMGFFCFLYITKMTVEVGIRIATGVMDGSPMPLSTRKQSLYQVYVPWAGAAMSAGVFLALGQLQMAAHAEDPGVRTLAYVAAFLAAVGAISWLVNGTAATLVYRSMLRQAEAD